jgi:hypothetical protein
MLKVQFICKPQQSVEHNCTYEADGSEAGQNFPVFLKS